MPSLAGVMPNRDAGAHSRRSQASASCVPPPIANPSTTATVGFGNPTIAASPAATASP